MLSFGNEAGSCKTDLHMSRISKKAVHAALDKAAANIISAKGTDAFVSRADIRQKLSTLSGIEQRLTDIFYRFMDARDHRPGARITQRDVDDTLAYAKEKLIDKYDLNNNGFSTAEIEKMSLTGRLAVGFAMALKRMALLESLDTQAEWLAYLGELSAGLVDFSFGSESDYHLEPVFFETPQDLLDQAAVIDLLDLNPELPAEAIVRSGPLSRGLFHPEMLDYYQEMDPAGHQRALEINRIFEDFLRQSTYFIIGLDNIGIVEHPVYFLGLTSEGNVAGYRGILIWT